MHPSGKNEWQGGGRGSGVSRRMGEWGGERLEMGFGMGRGEGVLW